MNNTKRFHFNIFRFGFSCMVILVFLINVSAQDISVIPMPVSVQSDKGSSFTITPSTTISIPSGDAQVKKVAGYLSETIRTAPLRIYPHWG